MKSKTFKKALAGMLATTMVLGMSMSAFAADETTGNVTGSGDFEGHVSKEVVAVTLPTDVDASTFAYKMDPEGLIPATDNVKYADATFEEGANVYFQSATNTYTKDSAKLKVVNRGTADVDVTVKAEVADNANIAMADSETFSGTDAELYLGLKVADKDAVAVKTSTDGGVEKVVGLKGKSDNFEITYDGTQYGYTPKAGVPETAWNSFEFGLTGACNPDGDYSADALTASAVTVTWSYAKRADDSTADMLDENAVADAAPSIATKTYSVTTDTAFNVPVSLGAGSLAAEGVSSAVLKGASSLELLDGSGTFATYADGKLTLTAALATFIVNNPDVTLEVIFNDDAMTKVILDFTV